MGMVHMLWPTRTAALVSSPARAAAIKSYSLYAVSNFGNRYPLTGSITQASVRCWALSARPSVNVHCWRKGPHCAPLRAPSHHCRPQNVFFLKDNAYTFCGETWTFYASATNAAGTSQVVSFPDDTLTVPFSQW